MIAETAPWAPERRRGWNEFRSWFKPRWNRAELDGRGQVIHVELTVKHDKIDSGTDEGLLWRDGAMLHFRGYRSTFDLSNQDAHIRSIDWPQADLGCDAAPGVVFVVREKKVVVDAVLPRWSGLRELLTQWSKEESVEEDPSLLPPLSVQKSQIKKAKTDGITMMAAFSLQIPSLAYNAFTNGGEAKPFLVFFGTVVLLLIAARGLMMRKAVGDLRAIGEKFGYS